MLTNLATNAMCAPRRRVRCPRAQEVHAGWLHHAVGRAGGAGPQRRLCLAAPRTPHPAPPLPRGQCNCQPAYRADGLQIDTGNGMTAETQANLFQRFFQGPQQILTKTVRTRYRRPTSLCQTGGAGLGLAISAELVSVRAMAVRMCVTPCS